MRARELIAKAAYGPETLAILYRAFDEAWDQLAPKVGSNRLAMRAARLKLANLILSLAGAGNHDAERLKAAALRILLAI